MKKAFLFAATLMVAALPARAGEVSVNLGLEVPLICRVEPLAPPTRSQGTVTIPQVRELCNGRGYNLFLEYDVEALDGATVLYGGQTTQLDESGMALIAQSNGAVSRVSPLVIEGVSEDVNSLAISFRIDPR